MSPKKIFNSKLSVISLLSIGFILRLHHFLENRSLWTEEAFIPLRLMAFLFKELFQNASFDPNLPIQPLIFILIEKTALSLWGNSEYALRLFPFVCSAVSLFVFYKILEKREGLFIIKGK